MIDLIEAGKNPAYTLSAMLYGLQNPIETEDVKYEVDMDTFGSISEDRTVCYGCAATSALEVITGRSLIEHGPFYGTAPFLDSNSWRYTCVSTRSEAFNTDEDQQNDFEPSIDLARAGRFTALMKFFGHQYHKQYDEDYDGFKGLYMDSRYWEDAVPSFEKLIEIMHEDYPDWERFTAPGEQDD